MNKKEVVRMFNIDWVNAVEHNRLLRGDVIAKREEWNNYVDYLCNDRHITAHQRDTWVNPY
jgi:hypothetical protein